MIIEMPEEVVLESSSSVKLRVLAGLESADGSAARQARKSVLILTRKG